MRHFLNPLFLLSTVLFFSACSYKELNKEAPEINTISPNTKFTIILPEDHRTGYLWQMSRDYNTSAIERLSDTWHGNEKGIYFNLKSLAAGQATLTFTCRKHTDTLDIKHFIVKIED